MSPLVNTDRACRPAEIVTPVGPLGSGKSTLLNMTAGLSDPTSGTVKYDGQTVTGINRRVGYMTQSDHLLPWRNVADNIAAPLQIVAGDDLAYERKSQVGGHRAAGLAATRNRVTPGSRPGVRRCLKQGRLAWQLPPHLPLRRTRLPQPGQSLPGVSAGDTAPN